MGRKQSKQNAQSNQASILQMWGSARSDKSIIATEQVLEDEEADAPVIAIDALKNEMVIDITDDTSELQSEGTRPPTSDEDIESSQPAAPLQKVNGRHPEEQFSSTKLFPIFSGVKKIDEASSSLSPNGGGSSRSKSADTKRSTRLRRMERTKSAPSKSVLHEHEEAPPLPLSQPRTGSNSRANADELVIDVDTVNHDDPKHGTREEPINIDQTPVKAQLMETSKNVNSFFAPRRNPSTNKVCKEPEQSAPWPMGGNQHVRGPQSAFQSPSLHFARAFFDPTQEELELSLKLLQKPPVGTFSSSPSKRLTPQAISPSNAAQRISAITSKHSNCASFSRFSSNTLNNSRSSQETWNERWHPRCAAEVTGNEDHARYLRDWLRALEVQAVRQPAENPPGSDVFSDNRKKGKKSTKDTRGMKRPTIIRAVDKSRRKRRRVDSDEEDIEDWIADDDEEDGNPWRHATPFFDDPDEILDPSEEGGSPWKPRMTRLKRSRTQELEAESTSNISPSVAPPQEESTYDFSAYLTNTILLSGPTGCGKTAAVYACAEELGWEVFEVYPGIGKRNGASLLSLVGDAGKHHLVGKGSTRTIRTQDAQQKGDIALFFLGKGSNALAEADLVFKVENKNLTKTTSPTALEQYLSSEGSHTINSNHENGPVQMLNRQSIILLEEVDVLFGEDVNFWPTVVTLIKESRRPVIMTCNDPNVIPFSVLPLQTVLYFNPCPPDLATSYIQCLALAEGHSLSLEDCGLIIRSQSTPSRLNIIHDIVHADRQSQPTPVIDLRRAINYTQYLCQGDTCHGDDQPQWNGWSSGLADQTSNEYGDFCDCCDEIPVSSAPDVEGARSSEFREDNAVKAGLHRLFCFSDTISSIDSNLERGAIAALEENDLDGDASGDNQAGYRHLSHQSTVTHLQGGIAFYNHDLVIASEAVKCATRISKDVTSHLGWHLCEPDRADRRCLLSAIEIQRKRSAYLERLTSALLGLIPLIHVQLVDALVLDYAPWIRSIDAADALLEAARNKENEARTLLLGGRTTRNSQRQKYERYLTLGGDQRQALEDTAFRVDDTLRGVDHEWAIRED